MKKSRIRLVFIILTTMFKTINSYSQQDSCDTIISFYHSKATCFSNGNNLYNCGIILKRGKVSPAVVYYHYVFVYFNYELLYTSEYIPKNIEFINNLEFKLKDNNQDLTFICDDSRSLHWRIPLKNKLNIEKEFCKIEKSLKSEIQKVKNKN